MKKILLIFLVLMVTFIAVGCNKSEDEIDDDENIVLIGDETDENDEKDLTKEEKVGVPSPLSGIYAPFEKVNRRPVAIMFDNHPKARWQAGLSQAEIVYEFMVEAPYTRYMGIFLLNDPAQLGPIRSSRPYFVTTLLEYDSVYVRVGGSEQAKKDIKELGIADIDGLSSSPKVFYRYKKTNKTMPHNLYTNMGVIRETQLERGYNLIGNYQGFNFFKEDTMLDGFDVKRVKIDYNNENSTEYIYDEKGKIYKRYKDGQLHIDEYYNTSIVAKNVIIQEANTKIIDEKGRLKIDLVGSGKGIYITNGKGQNIKWIKNKRNEKTKFYDEKGIEINLNPGITWIQVTSINPHITFE